ncbi:MAG TPA: HAMP domain-containing sensor histidine kinase [Phycicoccus sp.]|nr:HAMP domain-containing sensor histidine kinase [Phycicoccus sp.]HQH06319.1 HAMP domain-containing sensor histidine kinase [Phycicoccus sp.]HQK31049.1 HAMP domain-containing sensor histidine kinase [Phycicoccus sp.]HQY96758.1 HAMP domain-containing sensor histidine kinase [Phycicoccus sp.]
MIDRLGVRTRVIAVSSIMFAVVLGIGSVAGWYATSLAMAEAAEVTARATVFRMGEQLRLTTPEVVAPDLDLEESETGSGRFQQVWDAEGELLASTSSAHARPVEAAVGMVPPIGEIAVKRVPAVGDDDSIQVVLAVIRVKAPSGQILTALTSEPAHFSVGAQPRLIGLGLALVLTTLAGLVLLLSAAVRSALAPVDRMRRELERISSSREAATVTVSASEDEIGRLGATINAFLRRLHRSESQRAALVSDAGHELRSPLSTVALSLEQLRGDPPAARRAQIVQRGEAEVRRLATLVDDLLALAAADEGRLQPATDDIDLDDVVLAEVSVARAKGAVVAVDLAPARIRGAMAQVQRIVRNLLDNATRHARERIRVVVRVESGHAVLMVDNDGETVSFEDRGRIFERFYRLDDARDRDRGGSGLGLAIVESLTQGHGGTVAVTDAPDGWCRFIVRIPLADS